MWSAAIITRAFITKRNNPKLKIVAGRVRIINKGLRVTLKILKAKATQIAEVILWRITASPNSQAVINMASVLIIILMNMFILKIFAILQL